jgi:hypothetical protein
MPKELPSDEEIRARLRRKRPNMFFEAVGCVVVLAFAAFGTVLGVLVFEGLGGINAVREGHLRGRTSLLIPAGAIVGVAAGVVTFQMVRLLFKRRSD